MLLTRNLIAYMKKVIKSRLTEVQVTVSGFVWNVREGGSVSLLTFHGCFGSENVAKIVTFKCKSVQIYE